MTAINPLEKTIKQAEGTTNYLGLLFDKAGNSDHPRGFVPSAYRNARRAMKSALTERDTLSAALEVVRQLRSTVQTDVNEILAKSVSYGLDCAKKQLDAYNIDYDQENKPDLSSQLLSGSTAVLSVINNQSQVIQSVLSIGMDTDLILGDENRIGILRPSEVISAVAFWSVGLLWSAFEKQVAFSSAKSRIKKLAVACIDSRTTNCCLHVHGQVQLFDQPFELTGTPKYADRLDWSPFHGFCRTSVALYFDEYDDGITDGMKSTARMQINKR